MFRAIASVIFAVCAATTAASPARAEQPGYQTMSVKVSYADLDLGSDAGAKTLLSRLNRASHHVCGGRPTEQHLRSVKEFQSCVRIAMFDAVAQVGSATLTNGYLAQSGQKMASR